MNNIELVEYQRKVVDKIIEKSNEFLKGNDFKKILLQSPTGSGKTIMMSSIVQKLALECKGGLSFICISKGDLPAQSKDKFEKYIGGGALTFSFLEDIIDNTIKENEVLFINWEEIFSKANKDNPDKDVMKGDWTNIFMRDNEQGRFLKNFCENTRKENRKMVLIIDESHFGITENTVNIIDNMIKPNLQIDISATPKNDRYDYGDRDDEIIKLQTVKDAGIIKKEVIINAEITEEDLKKAKKGGDILVLENAIKKQKELKSILIKLKKDINPLVLIQLPNDEENMTLTDTKIKDTVEEFLDDNEINYENKKLALWLSGKEKENLEDIENIDNEVEYLIFKQAIALGWDCPRAYILVKFRDTKSATFEIQTVGRIMRMPEFKHYEEAEELNKAYVYYNSGEIDIDKEALEYILTKKSVRNHDLYKELNLKSVYLKRGEYNDVKLEYRKYFFRDFLKSIGGVDDILKAKDNFKRLQNYKKEDGGKFNLDILKFETEFILDRQVKDIDKKQEIKSENKIELINVEIKNLTETFLGDYTSRFQRARSVSPILTAIYQMFNKYLGFEESDKDKLDIQKIILLNKSFFANILQSSIKEYSIHRLKTEKAYEENDAWNIVKEDYYPKNAVEKKRYKKCIMAPAYVVDKWATEMGFIENYLEENKNNVEWWYKNGDAKNDIYLGIAYENKDGGKATFYPDFIVYYKDNKIGIFDTKSGQTETSEDTKLKAIALQKYIKDNKDKRLFGGILRPADKQNKIWQINSSDDYSLNDWTGI